MSAHELFEAVERQALAAWFDAASPGNRSAVHWSRARLGDATCYLSPTEPSILINRVLGLGSAGQPDPDLLREIRTAFDNAGVGRFFLHVLAEQLGAGYPQLLIDAGFEKYRGWMKFERAAGDVPDITTDLSLREIGPESAADFAAIVGDAFDFAPSFRPALAALSSAPGWRLYMSFDGDRPAGTGALYIENGIGYLDFGSTHPDFRRRGGQAGLVAKRLRDAFDAGCTSVVTMTGEAVPGEAQHSYRNILRAGFREAYLRENWIPRRA